MKGKIHISKDGVPRKCTAKGECKLGKHFDNKEEAQEYADKLNQETQENQSYIDNISEFHLNKIYETKHLDDEVSFPKKGDFSNTITGVDSSGIYYDGIKYKEIYEKKYSKELQEKEKELEELNKRLAKYNLKATPEIRLEGHSYKYAESVIRIKTEIINKNKKTSKEDIEKVKNFIDEEKARKQKENEQINKYVEKANLQNTEDEQKYKQFVSNMTSYKGFNKKAKEPTIKENDKTYILKHTIDENNKVNFHLLIINKNNEEIYGTFHNKEQMDKMINQTKDRKNLIMTKEMRERELKRLQDKANNYSEEYRDALVFFVGVNNTNYIKSENPTLKFDNGDEVELKMKNNKYIANLKTQDGTETLETKDFDTIKSNIAFIRNKHRLSKK